MAHIIVTATKQTFTGLVPDAYVSWLSEDERAACQAGAEADGHDVAEAVALAEEARSAANWRRSMAQDSDRSVIRLAAEVNGEVVGYAIGRPGTGDPGYDAELEAIHVLPSCQGRGIGRLLIQGVAGRLAEQGIYSLCVGTLSVNPNRLFYERLGGQYLYEREYNEGDSPQPGCVYGWKDTRVLLENTQRD